MKILHLPIKKKWFDMIKSGEKPEEYREIKDYWMRRLVSLKDDMEYGAWDEFITDLNHPYNRHADPGECMNYFKADLKEFDIVRFKNGYQKDAPVIDVKLRYVSIECGSEIWGAIPGKFYFVLKLGGIL